MSALHLSHDEAVFLAAQLRRHLLTVENELVHTDVRWMQRELAHDLEKLRELQARLDAAIADDNERRRERDPLPPHEASRGS